MDYNQNISKLSADNNMSESKNEQPRSKRPRWTSSSSSSSSSLKADASSHIQSITEREVATYKEEVEMNKSLLRKERLKFEQTESRLRRQITFLMEEAESSRSQLEDFRRQHDLDIEKLTNSRNEALSSLRQAEIQIVTLEKSSDPDEVGNVWIKKNEFLSGRIENLENNVRALSSQLTEKNKVIRDLEIELSEKSNDKDQEASLSEAPPALVSELNKKRDDLLESQRVVRIQKRKIEELERELKVLLPIREIANQAEKENSKLQEELASNQREILLVKNSRSAWENFFSQLHSAFPDLDTDRSKVLSPYSANLRCLVPPSISTILRHFQASKSSFTSLQNDHSILRTSYEKSKEKTKDLTAEVTKQKNEINELKTSLKEVKNELKLSQLEQRKFQASEAIYKREIESIQLLLEQTGDDSVEMKALQKSLVLSNDELNTIKASEKSVREELKNEHNTLISLQKEHDRVLNKFQLLKDALLEEREKAARAEERACQAETLAGKGSYNLEATRVLHLQSNPRIEALKAKYQAEIDQLLAEKRDTIENASFFSSPSGAAASKSSIDAQKVNQRLKEGFKEQISLFREGVYLLTGLKIDMYNNSDRPQFKIRSMYAEEEEDHLLFVWPEKFKKNTEVTSMDLCHSEFAEEVSNTDCFLYMTQYKSIPAFLATLTLSLFEKQTMV